MRPVLVRSSLALFLALPSVTRAQSTGLPIERGRRYTIDSRALGEPRAIDVALPSGYDADTIQRYPVLVVLDGEFEDELATSVSRFYAAAGQLPNTIVVGVRNTNRNRDLTPAPVNGFDVPPEATGAGGADAFLHFLGDELLPYIDAHYRTAPLRVLVGHSLGGLLALYALDHRPDLFSGYLVMEPAAWWNNGKELADARVMLRSPAARRVRLIQVNGEPVGVDTTQWGGNAPMVRQLDVMGETHESMALTGMAMGLRAMFADFRPAQWVPGTHPIAMLTRTDSLVARIGYAPPIPVESFSTVTRMSLDGRYFDDAQRVLDRWERTYGPSDESREYRTRLAQERTSPAPAGWVALEIPTHRPSAREARAFLGRWVASGGDERHEVEVRALGDTVAVRDRVQTPDGRWIETDGPVVRMTPDGAFEWGLPYFRGLAALLVLTGRVQADGTMLVTRQPRGWVPRQAGPEMTRTERFRRVTSGG